MTRGHLTLIQGGKPADAPPTDRLTLLDQMRAHWAAYWCTLGKTNR